MLETLTSSVGLIVLSGLAGLILLSVAVFMTIASDRADPMEKFSARAKGMAPSSKDEETQLRRKIDREYKSLERFSRFLEPTDETELSAARQQMVQAGYLGKNAVRDFAALQFILAISGLIFSLLLVFVIAPGSFETPVKKTAALLSPMLIGYYAPRRWLNKRIEARKEEILSGFPDSLDMLLVCVEAGQSLDQSIKRVAKEIRSAYPALGEELETVSEQVKAGRERSEVLREMSMRCGIQDITAFVTVLIQAANYGTSIGDALKVFSEEMRDKRIMRAEEKANLIPTKMTLGTMMFTVPPLLIILVGPSILGVVNDLSGGFAVTGN